MGWFVSPKILLLVVCVYNAWVFSQEQCQVGQIFCKAARGCTTREKCDTASLEPRKTEPPSRPPPECPTDQIFCKAVRGCTTREKCDDAVLAHGKTEPPSRPPPPECPTDQIFCKAIRGCTTREKCDTASLEPSKTEPPSRPPPECPKDQIFCEVIDDCTTREKCDDPSLPLTKTEPPSRPQPPECPTDQMFCPLIKSCTTKEKCDAECPKEGQMFCKASHNCTTQAICDVELERIKELERRCKEEGLMYCHFLDDCASPEECGKKGFHDMKEHWDCDDGEMFCPLIKSCTTKEKCDAECPKEGQMFCKASHNCTTQAICDVELERIKELERHCKEEGLMYCHFLDDCASPEECGKKGFHDIKEHWDCDDGEMFCPLIKSCTTKEKCDAECPKEGQMFCKASHNCTTQAICDVELERIKELERHCKEEGLMYCHFLDDCASPEECGKKGFHDMKEYWDCDDGEMFCPLIKSCTTKEKCDAECPKEGQMFCKANHNCTTQAMCDVELERIKELERHCKEEGLMYCHFLDDCASPEECSKKGFHDMKEHWDCDDGEMFCPLIKSCTTKEKCDAECPKEGQMFCKASHNCTTQSICDVELERIKELERHCKEEGLMYCHFLDDCASPEECDKKSFHDMKEHWDCDDGEKRCKGKCIALNEECDCDEGMAYCESRERCMREERLKDRFECPEVCDVEGEHYCPFSEQCIGENELCKCTREKPIACAPLKKCIGENEKCPCPKDHTFCVNTWGCLPSGVQCPTCKDTEKYCAFKGGCVSRDVECGCESGTEFCPYRLEKSMPACLNMTMKEHYCKCPETKKPCLTQMRCIDEKADCVCPEGQEYCPRSGNCLEGGCPKYECDEGQRYCPNSEECVDEMQMKELCPRLGSEMPVSCNEKERYCPSLAKCVGERTFNESCPKNTTETTEIPTVKTSTNKTKIPVSCNKGEKACVSAAGMTCIALDEECDCPIKTKYCDSIQMCLPELQLQNGECPKCKMPQIYCATTAKCSAPSECDDSLVKPPSCGEGEIFCPTSKKCSAPSNCDDSPEKPPSCGEGEIFCPTSKKCSAPSECDDSPEKPPSCGKGEIFCPTSKKCSAPSECDDSPEKPPSCGEGEIFCPTSKKCSAPSECDFSPPCPKEDPSCDPDGPPKSTKPPKNKNDYFFAGAISANLADDFNRGYKLDGILKLLKFKHVTLEGVLGNVKGRWQVMKSTVGTRVKATWNDMTEGTEISPRDSIRFRPQNSSVHGFEGIEVKIRDVSKYIGVIILPCVVPKLQIKKELSGEEDKPLNFNFDDVFSVTRKQAKVLVSNLVEEYNEFIPEDVLDKYRKMLEGGSLGQNPGIMIKSIGKHLLMKQREDSDEKDGEFDKKLPGSMLAVPKIFSAGSKLVFRPEKDVAGTLKIMIFPVDLPPGVKDLMKSCGVGNGVELIVNIANVNDRPSPRPIDPKNPYRLKLIVEAPSLPYELANEAANEGFTIDRFAKKAGMDADGDQLGIAVVKAGVSDVGQWQYLDDNNVWQNIDLLTEVNDKGFIEAEQTELLFLPPTQKIRFKPSQLDKVWRKFEALQTLLRFVLWDQSDGLSLGRHRVTVKGNEAISRQVLSVFMERQGCDDKPSSGLIMNECNECGKKSCRKCDGSTDSDAMINECKICVLGTTGRTENHGKDCKGICNGPHVSHETCSDACVNPKEKKITDCSGTCYGKKRISRCGVCSENRNAGVDACGVCKGDNSTCTGCDGVVGSKKKTDRCGNCRDPKSAEFNKGCTKLGAISPKTHATGEKIVYKLDASGFPESGVSCELRRNDISISLEVSVNPLQLTVDKVDNAGVYDLICTINSDEHSLKKAVTVFSQKISVSSVEPSELSVGEGSAEITLTGEGFMNSSQLFCLYDEGSRVTSQLKRSKRRAVPVPSFTKRLPAKYVSSSSCKCKVDIRVSKKIKIAVTFNKGEQNPGSYVELTVLKDSIRVKEHKLDYRAKKAFITFTSAVKVVDNCDDIFNEATMDKLKELAGDRKITCASRKADELVVHIPGAVLEEDLHLNFKTNAIKANEGFSRPSGNLNVIIKAPTQKILPIAVITAPKSVGSCDGFKLSAKNSKNTGKSGYLCKWSVGIEGVQDESSLASNIQDDLTALRNLFITNKCVFKIPRANVLEGQRYELKLVVSNRQGSSKNASHIIERSAKDIPAVRFITTANVFDLTKRQFVIKTRAKKPQCVEDSKLVFSWTSLTHPDLDLSDGNSHLLLKREMLRCDEQYTFALNVFLDSNPSLATYLTYNVTTKAAPLQFQLSGGDRSVPFNGIIKLKARSKSKVTCQGDLKHILSCVDEDDYPCLVKNKNDEFVELQDVESAELKLKANRFVANKTYIFKLVTSQGLQQHETSVKVKVLPGSPPSVEIKPPRNSMKPRITVLLKSSQNRSTSFSCEGVVENGYGFIDFEEKTKVKGSASKGEGMTFKQRRLSFIFKNLEPGVAYKVRCFAYYDDDQSEIGESTTIFKMKSPPEGGAVTVDPLDGVSSETDFNMIVSEFISESNMTFSYYTEKKGKRMLLASKIDRSLDTKLPAGDDDDDDKITIVAVAENDAGKTEVKTKIKSRAKQFNVSDFEDLAGEMENLEDEGDKQGLLVLALNVLSSAKNQDTVKEKVSELQENTTKFVISLLGEKRKEGSSNVKDILSLARNVKPQTEDSKKALSDEVTGSVADTVPESVKRRQDVKKNNEESNRRRRRAVSDDVENGDDDAGMTPTEAEDILATFENLIDTTVVNNNTNNFLETVDNLLINLCMGLPLGETAIAMSNLGILKTDMNYLDNVDTNFLNVSCTNCSMLNHSALVKFGSEIKERYNEWNCTGSEDELCNGLCLAMVQYPHDYITAVTSPVRLSDVLYIELKNPENHDYVPASSLTQPALFHIPLYSGYSQTSGHKCVVWSESEEQWSTSGCEKTQTFTRNGVVHVECSCTKLGYLTVHEDEDEVFVQTTTTQTPAPTTTSKMSTTKAKEHLVAKVQFKFDADYHIVIRDSEAKNEFLKLVENKLSSTMITDKSRILNVTVAPGSIIVNFVLLAPETNSRDSMNFSLTELQSAINEGTFTIMFNNQQLTADNGTMTFEYKTMTDVSPDETGVATASEDEENKLPIILGAVFGFLLVVVIVGAVLFKRHLSQQAKVSHQNIQRSQQTINTTCAQNTAYHGSVPQNIENTGTGNSPALPRNGSGGVRQTAELPSIE